MRSIYATFTALIFGMAALPFTTNAQGAFVGNLGDDVPMDYDSGSNTFSFSDMEPIQTSGSLSAPGWGTIAWTPGTPPDQLFTVGMFQDSFGFQNLSLNQISDITGQPVTDAPLSSFGPVQNLTISQLVSVIPGLGQLPVSMSPPILVLAQQQGVDTAGGSALIEALAPATQGTIRQLDSDLAKYAIAQIPGLEDVALQQLPGWANAQIAEIPGLSNIPLINPFSLKDYFVPFDIPFGMSPCKVDKECREFDIDNTASGNFSNLSIPCVGGPCSHIEVTRWSNDTNKIRWVSKEQKVPGGNGFLCTEEPTGRFPFGKNPKVVVEEVREEPGEVRFALYFSVSGPFGAESAHCFGPFPMPFWGERKEGQLILFGPDKPVKKSPLSGLVGTIAPQVPGSNGQPVTNSQTLAPPQNCEASTSTFVRPSSGPVTDEFGYSRWRGRNHNGIDLAPPYGTPIVAVNCGVVTYNAWGGGYGNLMRIKHPGGGETIYAHMAGPSPFPVGAQVKRGQMIGRIGSTGFSTGPHLHFEWHPRGWRSPTNPRQLGVF